MQITTPNSIPGQGCVYCIHHYKNQTCGCNEWLDDVLYAVVGRYEDYDLSMQHCTVRWIGIIIMQFMYHWCTVNCCCKSVCNLCLYTCTLILHIMYWRHLFYCFWSCQHTLLLTLTDSSIFIMPKRICTVRHMVSACVCLCVCVHACVHNMCVCVNKPLLFVDLQKKSLLAINGVHWKLRIRDSCAIWIE